jgi:hypothetical protein
MSLSQMNTISLAFRARKAVDILEEGNLNGFGEIRGKDTKWEKSARCRRIIGKSLSGERATRVH